MLIQDIRISFSQTDKKVDTTHITLYAWLSIYL